MLTREEREEIRREEDVAEHVAELLDSHDEADEVIEGLREALERLLNSPIEYEVRGFGAEVAPLRVLPTRRQRDIEFAQAALAAGRK